MYYFLSLFTGILVSVMVAFNGGLTGLYGIYLATVIIHVAGLMLISAVTLLSRENPFSKRRRWFLYLGGAIGVLTTLFTNEAFGKISVSAIMAIGLFGQSVTAITIDHYGLFGMKKHPFQKPKLYGLLLTFCGIAVMTDKFNLPALLISFAAGVTIVISRTLNAKLSDSTSVNTSTFYNYLIGLLVSLPVYFLFGRQEMQISAIPLLPDFYIYLGGVVGVCVILLSNITVTRISAFYLSLFLFVGQIFSGILIDIAISREFSTRNLTGGIFVAAGLCANLVIESKLTTRSE